MGHRGCRLWRPKKCCYLLVLLALLCVYFYVTEFVSSGKTSEITPNAGNSYKFKKGGSSIKTILAWTPKSGKRNWIPNTLKHLKCAESRCKVTEDRSQLAQSDIVILHSKDVDLDDLPPRLDNESLETRRLWALLNHEPPPHTNKHVFAYLNFQVDWTISYRHDATIYAPIYQLEPRVNTSNVNFKPTKKRQPATWLVSHCKTSSNREGYVAELRKFLKVDVYGKCGKKLRACPPKQDIPRCYGHLSTKYIFYLSFENSLCKDYVTEKVYLALQAGMIPVVFGGVEYENYLPPNSYVDALKFSSPQKVAQFLNAIVRNQGLYRSYFRWSSKYAVVQRRYKWLCDVCQRLHSDQAQIDRRKSTQDRIDLLEWWYLRSECKSYVNETVVHIDV